MTVTIDLVFDANYEPSGPLTMNGGIKITVDDARLFRFDNEEEIDWPQWAPEYLSGRITVDIWNILEAASDALDGTLEQYETRTVSLAGTRNVVIVQRLSKNRLRLAYHVPVPREGDREACPAAESERGYVVDAEDFGRAALASGQQYRSRAESLGFGPGEISWVVEAFEELEEVLEQ